MGRVVVFQGDSITDGNRYKDPRTFWDLNHYLGHGYPQMVAARLGLDAAAQDYAFHNRGVSGNRLIQMYARWQEDTLALRPDVLSILIGVNDCGAERLSGRPFNIGKYGDLYHMMLDETLATLPQVRLMLLEPFVLKVQGPAENPGTAADFDRWAECMAPVQQCTAAVAKEYGAAYVPLQGVLNDLCAVREASYWLWDGVHPTAAGHEVISREWMKAFESLKISN